MSVASKGLTLVDHALMPRRSPLYWLGFWSAFGVVEAALFLAGRRLRR